MINRIHLFCCYCGVVDFFEHTTPHIHSHENYDMVITTHMIHKMIGESKNKSQTEFEKIEENSMESSQKNLLKIKK